MRGAPEAVREFSDDEEEAEDGDRFDELHEVGDEDDDEGDPFDDKLCPLTGEIASEVTCELR